MYISIEVYKGDDNSFIAACPELNLSSVGKTERQAVDRLKEEIVFCLYAKKHSYGDTDIKAATYLYRDGIPKVH